MAKPLDDTPGTIITAAINGARLTKADHPRLPMTPVEIAAESRRCMNAGAAMVHVHARDSKGQHVLDAGLFREIIDEIEHATNGDLIVQATTETVGRYTPSDIIKLTKELQPEAISIALSELVPGAKEEAEAQKFLTWLDNADVWLQLILYTGDDVHRLWALQEKGVVPKNIPMLLFVLGKYAEDRRSSPSDLDPFIAALGEDETPWAMCAFGREETACAARAIKLGGHVRIGLENNLYLPDGTIAQSSADLVALAVENANRAGRPAMSARDVRAIIERGRGNG
ncbi:MAG: 3-keto-5-aminohexanoate cleavage protein [Hyphomicrobiaceae bacterium]